jgi:hypothetical protein
MMARLKGKPASSVQWELKENSSHLFCQKTDAVEALGWKGWGAI